MGEQSGWATAPNLVEALRLRSVSEARPKGAVLFSQGDEPRGVFVIEEGKARLSLNDAKGHTALSRIAGPGSVLGLPAVVANKAFSLTAELIEDSRVRFVSRKDMLNLMQTNVPVAMKVVEMLSDEVRVARDMIASAAP